MMPPPDEQVILEIYDTVLDAARWPGVLDRIARAVGARGCIIFELDDSDPRARLLRAPHFSAAYDPALVNGYIRRFADEEFADQEIIARHSARGDRIGLVGDDVLAPGHDTLALRPNALAMAEHGVHYRAGAVLNKDDLSRDRFSVQFSRRHGPLTGAERGVLDMILPHVAKALHLGRPLQQLNAAYTGLAEAMDRLRIGVCLMRADRQIICENTEFARQRDTAGVFFRDATGRLDMRAAPDRQWLRAMTGDARDHGRCGARPRKEALGGRQASCGQLAVEISPLTSADAFGERRLDGYALYSLDTGRELPLDLDLLAKVLTLTESETRLVGLMAEGLTNRQISDRRNRSVETINSQVKSLLAKADCANRTQLIRMASSIGASFVMEPPG